MPMNRSTNPSALNTVSGWTASYGTTGAGNLTRQTSGGPTVNGVALNYARATWTTASTASGYLYQGNVSLTNAYNIPVVAGETVSASRWVRSSVAGTLQAGIYFYDSAGVFISNFSGPAIAVSANTWTELKVENKVAPANAASALLLTSTPTVMGIGATFDVTGHMFNSGSVAETYFDGTSTYPNSIWTSAAGDSTSYLFEDYEYMYKSTGFPLGGDVQYPAAFIDLQQVSGLDLAPFEPNVDDLDGQHGGSVYVKYSLPRTIIIDGALYTDPLTIETTIDRLITNYLPDDVNQPFYFKHPGVNLRYCLAKGTKFQCDTDTLRRIGSGSMQIQLICEDPRKYIDNADQVMVANTNYTPLNPGNVNTYPVYTIVGAFTTITLTNNTQAKSVVLTTTRIAGDITVVDFKTRTVTINGVQSSNVITTANWWDIPAGGGQTVKYTVTGGPPTSVTLSTKQGWM